MEFWINFYNICRSRKVSPNKVGSILNISSATITKWKNGTPPGSEKLYAIADYFGVSTDNLLGRTGADPELPEDERELLQDYRRADERGKKRIRSAAKEEAEENRPEQKTSAS